MGKYELEGIVDELMDGEAEFILNECFAEMVAILPRPTAESQLAFLRAKQRRLREERAQPQGPHRPVKRGTANAAERQHTSQQVPHAYEEQDAWLACLRDVRWVNFPEEPQVPVFVDAMGKKTILVAHLFSGRRRPGDLHSNLHEWAHRSGIDVIVLSFDTAVSTHYGNLDHRSEAWHWLCRLYEAGWIACTLLGTPCETFSEARFQEPPSGQRWPRPLRSADRIYGLRGLTDRELRQVHVGSRFYLQGIQVLAYHVVKGGYYISEHPAPPALPERPSVWRAPLTLLLRQHPAAKLHVISQWEWHAEAVKPTGLLCLRLPSVVRSMRSVPDMATQRPTTLTVGKGPDGRFRTACLKEYPAKLSEALARSFTDQLNADLRGGRWRRMVAAEEDAEMWSWVRAAAAASMPNSVLTSWLPDFQG